MALLRCMGKERFCHLTQALNRPVLVLTWRLTAGQAVLAVIGGSSWSSSSLKLSSALAAISAACSAACSPPGGDAQQE